MSNELKKIVSEIQYITGATLEGIAAEVGYSRAYLTNEVSKGKNLRLLEILKRFLSDKIEHRDTGQGKSRAKYAPAGQETALPAHGSPDAGYVPPSAVERIAELQKLNTMLGEGIHLSLNAIQVSLETIRGNQAAMLNVVHTELQVSAEVLATVQGRDLDEVVREVNRKAAGIETVSQTGNRRPSGR